MTRILKPTAILLTAGMSLAVLSGCASTAPSNVPASYLQGTALDRNAISVEKKTEFLEVAIHPQASELMTLRPAIAELSFCTCLFRPPFCTFTLL